MTDTRTRVVPAAGAVEADSEHPIGRAITATARRRTGALPEAIGCLRWPAVARAPRPPAPWWESAGASAWSMWAAPYG
jgi:hypothetical protein